MINFKSIQLKNFMSYKDLEFNFDKQGIVLVVGENADSVYSGSNGSGKSALFESIFFALYGRTLREAKGSDVISYGEDMAYLRLLFDYNDDSFEVVRVLDGRGGSLRLVMNGKDVSLKDKNETQKVINRMLDPDIVCNALIFSGSVYVPFVSMPDADKKRVITTMLGFEKIETARELANKKVKELEYKLDGLVGKKNYAFGYKKEIEEQLKELEKVDVNLIDDEIADKKKEISELTKQIEQLNQKVKSCMKEEEERRKVLDELKDKQNDVVVSVRGLRNKIGDVEERKEQMQSLVKKGKCPTCGQNIESSMFGDPIEKYNLLLDEYNAELSKLLDVEKSLETKIKTVVGTKKPEANEYLDKMEKLRSRTNVLQIELEKCQSKKTTLETKIREAQKRHSEIEEDIKMLDLEICEIEKDVAVYKFWVEGFSAQGVISYILDSYFPKFNSLLNEYLQVLFGTGIVARFIPYTKLKSGGIREKWSFDVVGFGNYKNCSSGEKRRIDLAIMFALNNLVRMMLGGCNILVIDEGLTYLDDVGIEMSLELIKKLDVSSIFIAVQDDDLLRKYITPNKTITMYKKNGVSVIR